MHIAGQHRQRQAGAEVDQGGEDDQDEDLRGIAQSDCAHGMARCGWDELPHDAAGGAEKGSSLTKFPVIVDRGTDRRVVNATRWPPVAAGTAPTVLRPELRYYPSPFRLSAIMNASSSDWSAFRRGSQWLW